MVNIKRYIDRVTVQDNRGGRDVVIPLAEARALRDEIMKLVVDKLVESEISSQQPITVEVKGGRW